MRTLDETGFQATRTLLDLSIVVPVYNNAASLEKLCNEIELAVHETGLRYEVIAVCDASPDNSWEILCTLGATRCWLKGVCLDRNQGQHRAIWLGLLLASGTRLAVLGADLQDPPGALPALLHELDRTGAAVVFARHEGSYQSRGRLFTSRGFKWLRAWLAGVPDGSSLNLLMRHELLDCLRGFYAPTPFLVSMLGLCQAYAVAVDVTRRPRRHGASAYSSLGRLALGSRELIWILLWKVVPWFLRRSANRTPSYVSSITQAFGLPL